MRKVFSVICAVALLLVSGYALYVLVFEAPAFKGWLFVAAGAGMFLVLALYWIWEDFVHPRKGDAST